MSGNEIVDHLILDLLPFREAIQTTHDIEQLGAYPFVPTLSFLNTRDIRRPFFTARLVRVACSWMASGGALGYFELEGASFESGAVMGRFTDARWISRRPS